MNSGIGKIGFSILLILLGLGLAQGFGNAQNEKEVSTKSVSQTQIQPNSDTYIIGAEDVLSIQVWKEEALSQTVTVRTDGKISLPLIDEVQATGLTPLQLKEVLTQKFKAYVEDPIVTVMVREGKSFKIYITGQVSRPGVINLVGEVSFLQFIAQVGGFTEWANQKKILIIRKEGNKENRILVNYKKIVSGDAPNFMLKPGDVIIVPD
jgi:polysaccharide export outer membrane protein